MKSLAKTWGMILLLSMLPVMALGQGADTSFTQTAPPAPVGSGARAMGTGGAFIAIADDATAANWNPAGLVQLIKPEISFAANYEERRIPGDSSTFGAVDFISGVYPFSIGEVNVVTSVNYQRRDDFYFDSEFETSVDRMAVTAAEIQFLDPLPGATDSAAIASITRDMFSVSGVTEKIGSLEALSPAIAVQVTPTFALGFTYNFWNDNWLSPGYTQKYREEQSEGVTEISQQAFIGEIPSSCRCVDGGGVEGPCDDTNYVYIQNPSCMDVVNTVDLGTGTIARDAINVKIEEELDMAGQNFNVGFLWEMTPRWTLGGVYRSEFTLDVDRSVDYFNSSLTPQKVSFDEDMEMRMPASYGVGLAFRYNDELSFAADVSAIEWNRFVLERENGDKISPVNGLPEDDADIDPTVTYRVGGEYLIIQPRYIVPVRAGLFYDPEPARKNPDPYYGVAVGTGLVYEPVVIDLAYWYRFGNDVTLYTEYDRLTGEINEVEGDAHRQMVMLSAILHF